MQYVVACVGVACVGVVWRGLAWLVTSGGVVVVANRLYGVEGG